MLELTKLIVDNYGELHKLVQEAAPLLISQEAEAQSFFEEHHAEMTKEDILQGLRYMNSIMSSSMKNKKQIADNLLSIPNLFPRINDGNLEVLGEVATAFCTCKHLRITHVQYAMTFCALINPKQFQRFDNATLFLMRADGVKLTQLVHRDIISDVTDVVRIALLVKDFYDAIKDNAQDCNYADIHSVLTTIWKVLTDPRVIDAAIAGTLRVGLNILGLPPIMSNLLAKLVSMGLMDLLRPQLEAYRKRHFKKNNIN